MDNEKTEQEKIEKTDGFLTKQGKKILVIIEQNPGICSSDIAKTLGIRKNSASNALERIKNSPYGIDLIHSVPDGRKKLYYLTGWGEYYAKTVLCQSGKKSGEEKMQQNQGMHKDSSGEIRKRAEECIDDLKKKNPEWQFAFYEFIKYFTGNSEDKADGLDEETEDLMEKLLRQISTLYEMECENELRQVMEKISSNSVKERIKGWLEQQKDLRPLWKWVEDSCDDTYDFIDRLFEKKELMIGFNLDREVMNFEASKSEVEHVCERLHELINSMKNKKCTKKEFFKMFLRKYSQCDRQLAQYIAEKYKELVENV